MTTVPAHQTAADLLSAANHIETYGWRQQWYGQAGEPCCARGAIQVAVYGATVDDPTWEDAPGLTARENAANAAVRRWTTNRRAVTTWNDAKVRTKEDVVAGLHRAAEAVSPSVV
jgi:hypothetical protein